MSKKEIYYYRTRDPYGCFSNFSLHPFELDGRLWPTSEHYFQALKFLDPAQQEEIRLAKTPMLAAEMGRERKRPLRPNWERAKDDVMRRAVLAKFKAHADIRAQLLSTGDSVLIEKTTSDTYWGCGSAGTGRNMLGQILMEIRTQLLETELTVLYRPVGPKELELIQLSGFLWFPPRLPDQPIFYPVIEEAYAHQIAIRH